MIGTDPKTAHYPVDPARLDLVDEFRRAPKGPYSAELQKIVHRMRWAGEGGRFALMPVVPGRLWRLMQLPSKRGEKLAPYEDLTFTSLEDAEWAVFKIRWKAITGQAVPAELDQRP